MASPYDILVLLIFSLQIVPMKYNPRDENSIKAVMAKANVVINLIGVCSMIISQ